MFLIRCDIVLIYMPLNATKLILSSPTMLRTIPISTISPKLSPVWTGSLHSHFTRVLDITDALWNTEPCFLFCWAPALVMGHDKLRRLDSCEMFHPEQDLPQEHSELQWRQWGWNRPIPCRTFYYMVCINVNLRWELREKKHKSYKWQLFRVSELVT